MLLKPARIDGKTYTARRKELLLVMIFPVRIFHGLISPLEMMLLELLKLICKQIQLQIKVNLQKNLMIMVKLCFSFLFNLKNPYSDDKIFLHIKLVVT